MTYEKAFVYIFLLYFNEYFLNINAGAQNDTLKPGEIVFNNSEKISEPVKLNNAFYFELFGNAGYGCSVNYERKIYNKKFIITSRMGIGSPFLNIIYGDNENICSGMMSLNFLTAGRYAAFEAGTGLRINYYTVYNKRLQDFGIVNNFGIRMYSNSKKIVYRITVIPIWVFTEENLSIWGGFSFGFNFK